MSLANELDWPMQNWATGMSDNCWEDDLPHFGGDDLPSQSIYRRYVEWNRCALNDYQTQVFFYEFYFFLDHKSNLNG